jgi:hypothetical protein
MTALQAAVVNETLEAIAAQTTITDLNDGSSTGNAAGVIYEPIVQMLLRQLDPDFARKRAPLAVATTVPVPPYAFEYAYPDDCLRSRQVAPAPANYDPLDPQPIRWAVAFDTVSGVDTKVILTNLADAALVYTSSEPTEAQWDPTFREAVVERLAVPLAMALAGRPDFAKAVLEEAMATAGMAAQRDDGV